MKTILTTLNAKYIHTSLALRLLYVANKDNFDLSFREYVIKEDVEKIASELLATGADVIGISVSIWNVEPSRRLATLLKEQNPGIKIILGGPEVTYEADYFLQNWPVDYIIKGEGEFVLGELLAALRDGLPAQIKGVSSLAYPDDTIVKADLKQLEQLPSPYMLEADRDQLTNRLVYFESSRGCPYQCQYCLSSLEKGVRYYSQEYIEHNLRYLLESGARQIKFLDRTFNLNPGHTSFIFDFLIGNYRPGLSCQFEIYADILTEKVIDDLNGRLPEKYFRFEIGIQSTYQPTNEAVKRKQDFPLLAANVRRIMAGGKIDLHLDLIAGLPHETLERFIRSFNDVFELRVKEVQLGFLKMLRGTGLRRDAERYGYRYNPNAPYEIECNAVISAAELRRIHDAEHALEKFWNSGRFPLTMQQLTDRHYEGRYFEMFDEIAQHYHTWGYAHHGYQLEDLFRFLKRFLDSKHINLDDLLRRDYYGNYRIRPGGFLDDRLDKKERKHLLYMIGQDNEFLHQHGLTRKTVEKRAAIDRIAEGKYLLTFFMDDDTDRQHRTLVYDKN